ncbi:MAG: isopentenyl-diphosphate Delta-isomerase [Xanthomonadales bacterium]|nr:isopentenyl-diphosphate Delta-isomerase [Xanthomonadales bacterium]
MAKPSAAIVSFNDESLILVNSNDEILGYASKDEAHNGAGLLHRAFSLFIFNARGELLLQQRAQKKRLWGGYWSNSVCSHPRQGEDIETATRRRLHEELGLSCPLQYLYKFEYQAAFSGQGAENELCSVFIGYNNSNDDQAIRVNPNEISAWRWISEEQLKLELEQHPEKFTPWFIMEWKTLKQDWDTSIQQIIESRK